jgi:DNA helicase II / ATP-dependent DNA helicase PcrA
MEIAMSISNDVLNGLTVDQAAAAALSGAVLVLAGAGTGKTKTLTAGVAHRITTRRIPASRILAVTFTNKSAAEMLARIRAGVGDGGAPSWIGTFHGLGARQLRIEPEVAGLRPGFDIMDADDSRRIIKRVMKGMNLNAADDDVSIGRDPLKLMCNRISAFKDALVIPSEAAAHMEAQIANANGADLRVDPHHLRMAARVYVEYQRVLRDANAADFGDLLLWPVRAMQANRDYWDRWAGRFDAVLADEYQDVNQAQYSWLRLLAASHGELFAVGDDDQSIYSWRGADIRYIRRFTRDFPNATQVRLEENFRSTGHILSAANAVIAQDRGRLGKTLYTRKPHGDPIEVVRFRNAEAEAIGIVAEIQRRHAEGSNWQDMAILYRSNALSRGFEENLMRGRVPYVLVGDVGFYQRAEIKDALALLRLSAAPDSSQGDEAFRRIINVPPRGFGPRSMDAVEQEAAWRQVSLLQALETAELPPKARGAGLAFADAVRRVGRDRAATVADQISLLLDATGSHAMLRESKAETTEDKLANIQELIGLAGGFHSARDLLDHAALSTSGPHDESADRVRLMTMHKGKGLEFLHVFLPAWEAGTFPPNYGDIAEERRLGYVAITRGMRRVTITHCEFRRGYTSPSSFIEDLPAANRVKGWLRGQAGPVENARASPRPSSTSTSVLEDRHQAVGR